MLTQSMLKQDNHLDNFIQIDIEQQEFEYSVKQDISKRNRDFNSSFNSQIDDNTSQYLKKIMKNKKNTSRNNLVKNYDSDSDEGDNGHVLSPSGIKDKSKNNWAQHHADTNFDGHGVEFSPDTEYEKRSSSTFKLIEEGGRYKSSTINGKMKDAIYQTDDHSILESMKSDRTKSENFLPLKSSNTGLQSVSDSGFSSDLAASTAEPYFPAPAPEHLVYLSPKS